MLLNRFTLPALKGVKGDFNATSQSQFGGCATFDDLKVNNVLQGAYTCVPSGGSATSSGSTSTTSSPSSSSTIPPATSTQPNGGGTYSLSTGAKAAIGVCVPVIVIGILGIVGFMVAATQSSQFRTRAS
jgi:hypothetical protein